MRRSLLLPMVSLAGAFALGCADRPGLTDSAPDAAPFVAAEVDRFEQPVVFSFGLGAGDESVVALIGVGFEEFPAVCAGAAPQELADWMVVTHPSKQGGTSAHVQIKSNELSALVWPVDIGAGGDVCDLAEQPFVGTVRFTFVDNEGEFFETAPGANAFSQRFVGTVTDLETGQRYHLQGAIALVILPDGTVKELPVPFLRLTPIGG
jgi:hypothetical protein